MAHHHANGADTGCLGNQPSGSRPTPAAWLQNRPCHCTVPRPASADGGGKSCQRSQTRLRPRPPDCQCPAVRPGQRCPPLPAEDRRQCRHSLSFRKMAAYHPAGAPACRSPAVQQYRSPPGKHGPVVYLRPCTRPFQPAFRASSCTCCCGTEDLLPHLAPERAKNPRIGGLQNNGSLNAAAIIMKDYVSRGVVSSSGLRLAAICC